MSLLTIVLCVLLPPVAVFMKTGLSGKFIIKYNSHHYWMDSGSDTRTICEQILDNQIRVLQLSFFYTIE